MIHSFLLIGQSNMAGRGYFNEVEPIENPRIKVLRNGRWQNMFTPVNPDRAFAGVSLAESFADEYSKEHDVEVGLIPCADGGTRLDQWCIGSLLYDNAVYQARLAQRTSHIVGVLWHQGESDAIESMYRDYEEKFTKIMNGFRKDLNLHDVPFVLGGLGDFLENLKNNPDIDCTYYKEINESLKSIAEKNKLVGFADAKGLATRGDDLHFSSEALREFGIRYYNEFKKYEDKNKVYPEKTSVDDAVRTAIELL